MMNNVYSVYFVDRIIKLFFVLNKMEFRYFSFTFLVFFSLQRTGRKIRWNKIDLENHIIK